MSLYKLNIFKYLKITGLLWLKYIHNCQILGPVLLNPFEISFLGLAAVLFVFLCHTIYHIYITCGWSVHKKVKGVENKISPNYTKDQIAPIKASHLEANFWAIECDMFELAGK